MIKKYVTLMAGISALALITQAQTSTDSLNRSERQRQTRERFERERTQARQMLGTYPESIRQPNGQRMQLSGLSPAGFPLFNITDNLGAARTLSTDKVWPGGSLGLSLTGSGMTGRMGVWDGGAVLTTHQEFQGRVTVADGASSSEEHATHVAGTMVAGGVASNAKGGAYQAPLKSYDWDNDISEMDGAAGSGMLISNHSYGTISGWYYNQSLNRYEWYGETTISSIEDYKFGFYDYGAQGFDQAVYDNPYYLPFKSAGNDRGDYPSGGLSTYVRNSSGNWVQITSGLPPADGAYDCIAFKSTAKNILTIGAVNKINSGYSQPSDVVMSSFSGWGPTDDGRIKPDIVAAGVSIYSASNNSNTAYVTQQGTSMACPNASGSALLLQQHYFNRNSKYMRASSLKGLIIHTADEAGAATGPDYTYGWGLMNTAKAAQTISDSSKNLILESSLQNFATYQYAFVSDGSTPIRATLCWTDVPGTPVSAALDPSTRMLVNDLDLRIIRVSNSQEYTPYILNPANPSAAATTGDNFRDNLEQVYIAVPPAGTYIVKITHKGSLYSSSPQVFSLILSGRTPKPAANFSSGTRTSCTGTGIQFMDNSTGATSRVWYFPGGTPSTSTLQNPTVTYANPGTYPVALKVSNLSGSDSVYKADYMFIGGLKLPLTETFETNSSTLQFWSVNNPGNDSTFHLWEGNWGTSPGNRVVGINNYFGAPSTWDYLLSPVLDLRGMQNASLTFKHAYTRYAAGYYDSLVVSISTNCGVNWTRLLARAENGSGNYATYTRTGDPSYTSQYSFYPSSSANWCSGGTGASCYTINLNPYVGVSNVVVRFANYNDGGNNLFLDNISLSGTPFAPVAGFHVPQTVCAGQPVTFIDTSLNNPGIWNWTFDGAATNSSTQQNPKILYNTPGTYNVKLVVSNVSGTDSVIRNGYITVNATPSAPSVSASGSLSLCDGDSVTFTATGASNFSWYADSIPMGLSSASITVKNAGKYAVRTTATNGCQAQAPLQTVSVGSRPAIPTITKSLIGNAFCEGGSFTLTSSADNNNQWVKNGSDISGQTAKTFAYNDSGIFQVKVFNGTCFSISDTLGIIKMRKPQTSEIKATRFAYKNDTTVYFVMGEAGSTFAWTVNGGAIEAGSNTESIRVKWGAGVTGFVQVRERASNQCQGDFKQLNLSLWSSSLHETGDISKLRVFPNPAESAVRLQFECSKPGSSVVRLFDLSGKELLNQHYIQVQAHFNEEFVLGELPAGIYLLKIETENGMAQLRLVVE